MINYPNLSQKSSKLLVMNIKYFSYLIRFFLVMSLFGCSNQLPQSPSGIVPDATSSVNESPTVRPSETPKPTLEAVLATPTITASPTAEIKASPTLAATKTPEVTPTQDISKLPADIQSIGPDAKYFQIQPDKSVIDTRDGSTAYDKDGKLVGFKYGNWDNVANPEKVSMAATRCETTKTPCIAPAVSSFFKGKQVSRVDAVSTGAMERRPFVDPLTGLVFGSEDVVVMKTKSKSGEILLFDLVMQLLERQHGTSNFAPTGYLIDYLTNGKADTDISYEISTGGLLKILRQGVEIDLSVMPTFPEEKYLKYLPTNPPPLFVIEETEFYKDPNYLRSISTFLDGKNQNVRPKLFFWSSWDKTGPG